MHQKDETDGLMETKEAHKTVEVIGRWMQLRAQGGYAPIKDDRDFLVHAEHSLRGGLLSRLLIHGKEPLEHTPPLLFSRPWYSLIESGEAAIENTFVTMHSWKLDVVLIGKHAWRIIKRDGDDLVLEWRPGEEGESHWGLWRLAPNADSWTLSRDREGE